MSSEPSPKGPQRSVQIGKYTVLVHLATGGMGAVYKAYDTEAKRDVALKVLTPEMASKPLMIERFRREARNALKLRHDNIVELFEFGEAGGQYFLAMEFIEGLDLHEYVERKGMLDPEEALRIIVQAAKALDHAHGQGIVHRDIKPSNFLVTRSKKGKLLVKMTDLGLSRETNAEEFRVTRAGTTVGTVDYISPEQARDSGLADIRSDLYSLGCTWYHLLAAKPVFPEGGLAERLNKHLNVEPPDVRHSNPRASKATVAVLRRLLAKRPADRYQTPAELLRDLVALKNGGAPTGRRAVLLGLLNDEGDDFAAAQTAVLPTRKTKAERGGLRRSSAGKGKVTDPASRKPVSRARLWYVLGGVAAGLLVAVSLAMATLACWPHPSASSSQSDQASHVSPSVPTPPPVTPSPDVKPPDPPPVKPATDKPSDKPHLPVLDPTATPVDAVALRKEIEAPWAALPARPADAPVLHVARAAAAGQGPVYPTLAAAAAAAPADKPAVLEIDDDGPFFETSTVFADRQIVICAGQGFRPLLVWDAPRTLEERRAKEPGAADDGRPPPFLSVERGGLLLENLDVVFKQPDSVPGGLTLLDLRDADLTADGCTFSLAGKPREGTVLARFRGTRPEAGHCRFTRCVARGPVMTALDMDTAAGSVLFDRCLVAGGDPALLVVRAADARPLSLAVVRSTLVCGRTLLNVQRAAESDRRPTLQWLGWDALLSRSSDQPGGDMVSVAAGDGVDATGMKWRATNCLYSGWQNLLIGPETVAADTAKWRAHWERSEGDVAIRDPWPAFSDDPSVLPPSAYRAADTPVGFAATAAPDQPLGCDMADLPPARDNWPALTVESFVVPPLDPITDDDAPTVNPASDGLYHGGPVDFTRTPDVGALLRDLQQKKLLAPRVVLLLSGGEHAITPFHLRGCSLVLHADAPAEGAVPLTLTWDGQGSVGQEGLIEIEDGGLEMTNVAVKQADFPRAATPAYLLKVRGDLRLFRCRLEGPQQYISDSYRGVILLQGSGDPAANAACAATINESVLLSGRDGVQVRGVGARLLLRQSVVVAGGDALHLDPGPTTTPSPADGGREGRGLRANVQCVLERSTLAARRAIVHLEDAARPADGPPADPMLVRSRECAFLDPFGDKSGPAGMLALEKSALAHGLLVWQGEGDAFGKRLTFAAEPASAPQDKEGGRAAWARLWGSYGDRHAAADAPAPAKPFDAPPWPLDRLALPKPAGADKHAAGADLALLRLAKKPAKP